MLAAMLAGGRAHASVTFTGSGGGFGSSGLKEAKALFDVSGSNLQITLTNTATSDVLEPADVLTALFFDVSGSSLSLTPQSATLSGGSTVFYDPNGQPPGGVVGGEWAYRGGLSGGTPQGAQYGVSSTGLNWFGPNDRFPGPNLSGPASPDGLQYGLLSKGDDTSTGNGGITGSGGLIKNEVAFVLSGLPGGFDLARINNVFFLYGTSVNEGGFGGQLPTPGTAALLGLAGALAMRRRRRAV